MFELLSNVKAVPIDQGTLTSIQRGMNKVRVSVGEHNSEPSEVYIITGLSSGNLETYIIFYILEPGIRVVYGFEQNPYPPAIKEQVIEEATIFVEEMGTILEEVPLEAMTQDQRKAWFEGEVLFSEPIEEEIEEIEELDEVEMVQIEDPVDEETQLMDVVDLDLGEDIVEVSDEELKQAQLESDADEDRSKAVALDEVEDPVSVDTDPGITADSVDAAGSGDVVVADGDFDELLKQAFLKPEIVEKTRRKAESREEEIEEEYPLPEDQNDENAGDTKVDDEFLVEEPEYNEDRKDEHELSIPEEPDIAAELGMEQPGGELTLDESETFPEIGSEEPAKREIALSLIRFLSKF